MSSILDKIKDDLKEAMKNKKTPEISALRVILGELQRQSKKDLTDSDIVKVIKTLIKYEELNKTDYIYESILKSYIPEELSDNEIKDWILKNIDFSQFKNKMQSMRFIMDHFGPRVDGNKVKKILLEL